MGNKANPPIPLEEIQRFLTEVASISDIQIEEFIGNGTFGVVFKAKLKNDPTQVPYAVKIITADQDGYVPELKTLKEYYSIIKQCCPDCLVTIYPSLFREGSYTVGFKPQRYLVIVSEYVPKTLEELKGQLKPKDAVELILPLIRCLKSFSKKGLIYTDLKPENLGTFESLTSCKILDIGGFKRSKQLEDLAQTIKLSRSSSSGVLFTPRYAPLELQVLHTKGRAEIKEFIEQELKEGRAYSYMLGAILGELIGAVERDPETSSWIVKESELRPLLEKALQRDREKRPLLEEFEEELKRYLYGSYKPLEVKETKQEEPPKETREKAILKLDDSLPIEVVRSKKPAREWKPKPKPKRVSSELFQDLNEPYWHKVIDRHKVLEDYIKHKPIEKTEHKELAPQIGLPLNSVNNAMHYDPAIVEAPQTLNNYVVKSGQRLVLEGKTYRVNGDIKIEPGGELIIRNATVEFSEDGGIIGKDCTFVAENSKFLPQKKKWKNITLVGNIKGNIEECLFKGGRGRLGKEINEVKNLNLWDDKTMGGALFIESSQIVFLIKDSTFESCSADMGGGAWAYQNNRIENCKFENCNADRGGGGGIRA